MWLVASPKRFDSLDIAEQRLNTHGLFVDNGFFERVTINDILQADRVNIVRFYIERKSERQGIWLELLLGDVCTISTADNICDTLSMRQALRKRSLMRGPK